MHDLEAPPQRSPGETAEQGGGRRATGKEAPPWRPCEGRGRGAGPDLRLGSHCGWRGACTERSPCPLLGPFLRVHISLPASAAAGEHVKPHRSGFYSSTRNALCVQEDEPRLRAECGQHPELSVFLGPDLASRGGECVLLVGPEQASMSPSGSSLASLIRRWEGGSAFSRGHIYGASPPPELPHRPRPSWIRRGRWALRPGGGTCSGWPTVGCRRRSAARQQSRGLGHLPEPPGDRCAHPGPQGHLES